MKQSNCLSLDYGAISYYTGYSAKSHYGMENNVMNYRETMLHLNSALNNVDALYATIAKKHGLTFNALMMFYLIDEAENITQKQICEALHLPKSTVHSILLDFVKQDYATLVDSNNKKEKFIAVTQTGDNYFRDILEETRQVEQNVLEGLGEENCTFLTKIADSVETLVHKEMARIDGSGVK